jgi:hypothetical protein
VIIQIGNKRLFGFAKYKWLGIKNEKITGKKEKRDC